jgi:predicted amidophosphoribosyltransferase
MEALHRVKATRRQVGLGIDQRARNVQGAFRVPAGERPKIEGYRVLLVDDVYTTGATVKACTRALKRAGASAVDVLTFAMAGRGDI